MPLVLYVLQEMATRADRKAVLQDIRFASFNGTMQPQDVLFQIIIQLPDDGCHERHFTDEVNHTMNVI